MYNYVMYIYGDFAIKDAPPETKIEQRRWWNQICINALDTGRLSGCYYVNGYIMRCKGGALPCDRCDQRDHMNCNPEAAYIGFTPTEGLTL